MWALCTVRTNNNHTWNFMVCLLKWLNCKIIRPYIVLSSTIMGSLRVLITFIVDLVVSFYLSGNNILYSITLWYKQKIQFTNLNLLLVLLIMLILKWIIRSVPSLLYFPLLFSPSLPLYGGRKKTTMIRPFRLYFQLILKNGLAPNLRTICKREVWLWV